MPGDERCPVCGRAIGPAGAQASCAECGWVLNTRLRAGALTDAMRQEFAARLLRAGRAQAERDRKALDAALAAIVGALRPGAESAVVEVSPERIAMVTAYLDDVGTPRVRDGWTVDWAAMLPMLPGVADDRRARLADGIDRIDAAGITRLVRNRVPEVPGGPALVVCRPAGWRVLEAAAAALGPAARLLRVTGENGNAARDRLAGLASASPLTRPYYLMTAVVNPATGTVSMMPRQLFAVGTAPGTESASALPRLPGDVAETTLAIFAGESAAQAARGGAAEPVAMYQLPPQSPTPRLRVILDGPGKIRIAKPDGAVPHPYSWAQVRDLVPARVSTTTMPADLVCAIDLSGEPDVVRRRKSLVRELIQLVAAEYPAAGRLRVAVVTCTDHVFGRRRGAEYKQVTSASELASAAAALGWLNDATGVDIADPLCAPVEDLLNASLGLLPDSKRLGRRPQLLTLAGRQPHPYPQLTDGTMACPLRFRWQLLVEQLDQAGVKRAVVADGLPTLRDPARVVWNKLGPAGQRALTSATARQLAEDLGLLTGRDQCIPLPLSDEYEGASR